MNLNNKSYLQLCEPLSFSLEAPGDRDLYSLPVEQRVDLVNQICILNIAVSFRLHFHCLLNCISGIDEIRAEGI